MEVLSWSQDDAARLLALRAETIRGDSRGLAVGMASVIIAQVMIIVLLAPRATTPWLWIYAAAMATVVASAGAMSVAQRRLQPGDLELMTRWMPVAGRLALAFQLLSAIQPWVLMPLATPTMMVVLHLTFVWGLAVSALFATDDEADSRPVLIGLPVSLSAYMLLHDLPLALPLAILYCAAGLSLAFYERSRHRQQRELYAVRIAGERAAGELLARIERSEAEAAPDTPMAALAAGILTPRQLQVLRQVAKGLSNKQIARELDISPATVKVHVAQILAMTGAGNRTAAAVAMLKVS